MSKIEEIEQCIYDYLTGEFKNTRVKDKVLNYVNQLKPYMDLADWVIKHYVRTIPTGDFLIEGQEEMEEFIRRVKEISK
jgi:hypothetical protein